MPPRNRLRQDMHLELRGREYVVAKRLPDGKLQLRDVHTETVMALAQPELNAAYVRGLLRYLGDAKTTVVERKITCDYVVDITVLDEDDPRKVEMRRRLAYVQGFLSRDLAPKDPAAMERAAAEIHAEIKDPATRPPHWKTVVYSWQKEYLKASRDVRSLVPAFKNRGNHLRKFCGEAKREGDRYTAKELEIAAELEEVIEEVLREKYLTLERPSVNDVHDALLVRLYQENLTRPGREFPAPAKCTLHRIVRKWDKYEVAKARHGKEYADRKFNVHGAGVAPTRPLERVEIDSTRLDLMVIDEETGLPIGRPTFTVAFDVYTRAILGFYVSFDGEGALRLLQCLLHAVLPKTYVAEQYGDVIRNESETFGLPELIATDNGPGQHSRHFEDACLQLGIPVLYCPVRRPWLKGSVERYMGSQNVLLHGIPGTTFSNIFDRGDYDPERHAIVGFKTLLKVLHKWVIDVYMQKPHRGIMDVPARRWREGVAIDEPQLPPHRDDLRPLLGHVEQRTIQSYGIDVLGLRYSDPALELFGRRYAKGTYFKIKYNPRDLSVIYLFDPADDTRVITVPSTNLNYTRGLTLYQHKVTQKYLRNRMRKATDPVQLAIARREIMDIVERDWKALKRKGPRVKAARLRGVAQPDYSQPRAGKGQTHGQPRQGKRLPGKDGGVPLLGPVSPHVTGTSRIGSVEDGLGLDEGALPPVVVPVVEAVDVGGGGGAPAGAAPKKPRAPRKSKKPAAPAPAAPAGPPAQPAAPRRPVVPAQDDPEEKGVGKTRFFEYTCPYPPANKRKRGSVSPSLPWRWGSPSASRPW